MNTKETREKLQKGYHAMINSIESLIKNEGKSLKQALDITEHKLKDWEDLSVEQYKRIRNEVRYDLYTIADKMDGTRSAFKHRLEMDSQFMKKSAIDKLSSIADNATLEFVELKNTFFEKGEELTKDERIQAEHLDHTRWHDDHLFWTEEIAIWRKETHDAEAKILAIHNAVNKHGISLRDHVKNIRSHDKAEHDHEVKLATLEKALKDDTAEDNRDQLAHKIMSKSHKSHALLHQQFKNKHREILILVARLYDLTHA